MSKAGYVAIIGLPNAGKSTLMNAIIGAKLSAVTSKPQTTRKRVLGILSEDDTQIVFLDTPGLLVPKYKMQSLMMGYVSNAISEADCVLCIYDATRFHAEQPLPKRLEQALKSVNGKPVVLAINKIDQLDDIKQSLPIIATLAQTGIFADIVPISALKKNNTSELVKTLIKYIPEAPFYYDPELLSTQPERFFVSEIIREKIFKAYSDEIPYSTEVQIVQFKEREEGKWLIDAEIIVERSSQKAIIIGAGGDKMKVVMQQARADIEEHLQMPIFLNVFVKVRDKWRSKPGQLNALGY